MLNSAFFHPPNYRSSMMTQHDSPISVPGGQAFPSPSPIRSTSTDNFTPITRSSESFPGANTSSATTSRSSFSLNRSNDSFPEKSSVDSEDSSSYSSSKGMKKNLSTENIQKQVLTRAMENNRAAAEGLVRPMSPFDQPRSESPSDRRRLSKNLPHRLSITAAINADKSDDPTSPSRKTSIKSPIDLRKSNPPSPSSSDEDELSYDALKPESQGAGVLRSLSMGSLALFDKSWNSRGRDSRESLNVASSVASSVASTPSVPTLPDDVIKKRDFRPVSMIETGSRDKLSSSFDSIPSRSNDFKSQMSSTIKKMSHFPRQHSITFTEFLNGLQSSLPDATDDELDVETVVEDNRKVVTEGSVEALVYRLASYQETEVDFVHEFLYTFRYFTNAREVLTLLIARYEMHAATEDDTKAIRDHKTLVQVRVLNAIRKWVIRHFSDFVADPELLDAVEDFVKLVSEEHDENKRFGKSIGELIAEQKVLIKRSTPLAPFYDTSLPAGISKSFSASSSVSSKEIKRILSMSLLDHKCEDVAKQLTILEMEMFRSIEIHEFFAQSWTKMDSDVLKSPNLFICVRWFNRMASWVATEICLAGNLKLRVTVLKHFLKIAAFARSWNNFNTIFEIMAGLNSASVSRLRKTWSSLPSKYRKLSEELNADIQSNDNWKRYRQMMRESIPPVLPYIGVFLSDLTFAEEGPTFVQSTGRVNFYKMRRISRIFQTISRFQDHQYHFEPNQRILHWFRHGIVALTSDELFKASYRCEASKEVY